MKDSPILGWTILRRPLVTLGIVLTCPLLWASVCVAQSKTNPADPLGPDHAAKMTRGLELFKKQVRQVLTQRCLRCHGGKSVESEFDLSDRDKLLHGGTTGPAIVLGNSKDSLLIKLVNHAKEPHMPHNAAKLPAQAVAAIAAWIDDGAPTKARWSRPAQWKHRGRRRCCLRRPGNSGRFNLCAYRAAKRS